MKRVVSVICAVCFFVMPSCANAAPEVSAKAMILVEASSGRVLAENNADERLPIASITKIMTLLLCMEAIDAGRLTLDEKVTVSENAMSMGGSTMFLETGEELSVHEMIKGIAVASANDGCVAIAEHLCGSEEEFVAKMNERARELGMENTQFMNTNGLDEEGHYSSARDVAKMSAELIKHEKIFEYTTIWTGRMHNDEYELANTNKLIRFYSGANGLKTGSTSQAGCCLSATAKRDGMQLIAVVLGAPTSKERFDGARSLLDYGFAGYTVKKPWESEQIPSIVVNKGREAYVTPVLEDDSGILLEKGNIGEISLEWNLPENIAAPIAAGQKLGELQIVIDGNAAGTKNLISGVDIAKKSYIEILHECIMIFLRV